MNRVKSLRERHDGWTRERQRAFFQVLADTGSVSRAVAAVGLSRASAYALRRHAAARGFASAWDAAIETFRSRPSFTAVSRPICRDGRVVAIRTVYRGVHARRVLRETGDAFARIEATRIESIMSTSASRARTGNLSADASIVSTSAVRSLAPASRIP